MLTFADLENRKVKKSTPILLDPDYQLEKFMGLMKNDPEALPDIVEKVMNVNREEDEPYKIPTPEQHLACEKIYLRRKIDPNFNQKAQLNILRIGGVVLALHGLAAVVKAIDENN